MRRRRRASAGAAGEGGLTAFIDESMRASLSGGLYLVASAVLVHRDLSAVEHRLLGALGGRRRRVHWHSESVRDREEMLDTLACLPLQAVCAAVEPSSPRRQERARERGLWTLAPQLESLGVTEMVFEARQEHLNRRDERSMGAIQRAGMARTVRFRFALPDRHTPALWAADAIAGAVGLHVAAGDDRYVKRLPAGFVTIHQVAG